MESIILGALGLLLMISLPFIMCYIIDNDLGIRKLNRASVEDAFYKKLPPFINLGPCSNDGGDIATFCRKVGASTFFKRDAYVQAHYDIAIAAIENFMGRLADEGVFNPSHIFIHKCSVVIAPLAKKWVTSPALVTIQIQYSIQKPADILSENFDKIVVNGLAVEEIIQTPIRPKIRNLVILRKDR